MKDKIAYIEVNEEIKYPLCFNLNVMEEIQENYGSMSKWGSIVENKEDGEPNVKDLKKGLLIMINEAIDIENEKIGETKPLLTAKQVGRIITDAGFDKVIGAIKNITRKSTSTGNENPNE